MDLKINCLVNGADLVRQHLPQLRTGIEFPSVVRPNSHDHLRGFVQYSPVDELVSMVIFLHNPDIESFHSFDLYSIKYCCKNRRGPFPSACLIATTDRCLIVQNATEEVTGLSVLSPSFLKAISSTSFSTQFPRLKGNDCVVLYSIQLTMPRSVKSDALFSYQPPFNILAFILLKPASWVLTPRALHSFNVFLIKITSLPQLVVIGTYERYLASGRKLRETSKDAAQSLFNSLPRHIKNMPLIEALVGSVSNDLFDVIFDVEVNDDDYQLFDESDLDAPALRSLHSRENIRAGRSAESANSTPTRSNKAGKGHPRSASISPSPLIRTRGPTGSLSDRERSAETSAKNSPKFPTLALTDMGDAVASPDFLSPASTLSPLARVFGSRFSPAGSVQAAGLNPDTAGTARVARVAAQAATSAEATMKQIETLLQNMNGLPVQKLKEEMKELQVRFHLLYFVFVLKLRSFQERQARIENLLLLLTRGMRNEVSHGSRQGTIS